jgi:hypothetical protein
MYSTLFHTQSLLYKLTPEFGETKTEQVTNAREASLFQRILSVGSSTAKIGVGLGVIFTSVYLTGCTIAEFGDRLNQRLLTPYFPVNFSDKMLQESSYYLNATVARELIKTGETLKAYSGIPKIVEFAITAATLPAWCQHAVIPYVTKKTQDTIDNLPSLNFLSGVSLSSHHTGSSTDSHRITLLNSFASAIQTGTEFFDHNGQ